MKKKSRFFYFLTDINVLEWIHGALAQLIERGIRIAEVTSLILVCSTILGKIESGDSFLSELDQSKSDHTDSYRNDSFDNIAFSYFLFLDIW